MNEQPRLELDDLVLQAESLVARGEVDPALALLSQVVQVNPGHARALNDLGTICYGRGALDYAAQFFSRALAAEPGSLVCRANLVTLLLDQGRLPVARELLLAGEKLHPAAASLAALGQELLLRERQARMSQAGAPAATPPAGAADRDAIFEHAFQLFLQQPEACAQPGSAVLKDLIYGWGNEVWGAPDEFLAECIQQALAVSGPVLECGSGLSTLVVGAIAQKRGQSHWALEHLPEWGAKVQQWLDRYSLDAVKLCVAPVKNHGAFSWYDAPLAALPLSFSLVICDGPPGNTVGGRYGLVPVMKPRLSPGCVLLLDDAHREHERAIAACWKTDLGSSLELCGRERPYIRMTLPPAATQNAAAA